MYDFAVLGGDLRQFYMAKQLAFKGYSVITYGIASGKCRNPDRPDPFFQRP